MGSTVGYTKISFSYDKYVSIFNTLVVHPSLWIGIGDKSLPLSEQFSLGGPETFWGYAENDSLGRQVLVAELRVPL